MGERGKIREVPFAELGTVRQEVHEETKAVNWLLNTLAERLQDDSATAKAIRRSAPWRETLRFARWEGVLEVVDLLEDAIHTLGPDLPPEVLGDE